MTDPRPLAGIASIAWEHPADRAALNAARALPGFDEVVRKVVGFFGDRGIRQLFLAKAVRVGPTQRPKLHALYGEMASIVTTGVRMVPARALELGYSFSHPDVDDALRAALAG